MPAQVRRNPEDVKRNMDLQSNAQSSPSSDVQLFQQHKDRTWAHPLNLELKFNSTKAVLVEFNFKGYQRASHSSSRPCSLLNTVPT
eukprot:2964676-Amphidinium_carterae.1